MLDQFGNRLDDRGVSFPGLDTTDFPREKRVRVYLFFFSLYTRSMRMIPTGCRFLIVFKRVVIDWVRVVM